MFIDIQNIAREDCTGYMVTFEVSRTGVSSASDLHEGRRSSGTKTRGHFPTAPLFGGKYGCIPGKDQSWQVGFPSDCAHCFTGHRAVISGTGIACNIST
jgi:hypothetical protein